MSAILRALRTLPIFVVASKTKYNEFHPDAAVPTQDTGTGNDSLNAGGALVVTQITDISGKVAWKDYIPVQAETGRTVPYSYDANGYFPIKKASGSIFESPDAFDPATKGTAVTLSNGSKTAVGTSFSNWTKTVRAAAQGSGKWYCEFAIGAISDTNFYVGPLASTQGGNGGYIAGHVAQRPTGAIDGGGAGTNGAASWTNGDIVCVALDMSGAAGCTAYFYKNGVANGSRAENTTVARCMGLYFANTGSYTATIRTASAEFSYSPPSGYQAWAAMP